MTDFMKRLREQAAVMASKRAGEAHEPKRKKLAEEEAEINAKVADFLGASPEETAHCCGSICPHCDIFLDKAIALVELGYPSHLFMNPSQEELFEEALRLYRSDLGKYQVNKRELMDRMRRPA